MKIKRFEGNYQDWLVTWGIGKTTACFLDCAKGVVPMANSGPVPRFDLRKGGLVGLGWVAAATQRLNEADFLGPLMRNIYEGT